MIQEWNTKLFVYVKDKLVSFYEYWCLWWCWVEKTDLKGLSIPYRARPIRFFWADIDVFHFSMLISDADTDTFVLLKQLLFCLMKQNKHSWNYFASWGKINTPRAILPSSKHFPTITERHYSAFFLDATLTKKIISQVTIVLCMQNIHSSFSLWGKIYTLGAILLPAERDCLNWSHNKFGQHDCLSWLWHL